MEKYPPSVNASFLGTNGGHNQAESGEAGQKSVLFGFGLVLREEDSEFNDFPDLAVMEGISRSRSYSDERVAPERIPEGLRLMTSMLRRLAPVVLLSLAAGCRGQLQNDQMMVQAAEMSILHQPRELEMVSMPPYVVEPPDELEISVRPSALEFSTTSVTVRQDGVIDLGFSGDLYVVGLTLDEVELKIAQRLSTLAEEKKLRDSVQVSVRLLNSKQSKQYYVIGAVSQQGRFPITGKETVLDGILQAGLKSYSQPENAYLVRAHPHGGKELVLPIDWDGIKDCGDTLTNYQLMPGDRIVVPGGKPPGLLKSLLGGG